MGKHGDGAVALFDPNPDIIWVGTGEGNVRNSTSIGGGMFKSIDGGRTWRQMGLAGTERINRIALHPSNPDIVYAAALGTPKLNIVHGTAPDALAGLKPPDAVFIGGGVSADGVLEACWRALRRLPACP